MPKTPTTDSIHTGPAAIAGVGTWMPAFPCNRLGFPAALARRCVR
jgi:hypothetical protein